MNIPAIETRGLAKTYKAGITKKSVQALTDVGFTVGEGEIFAFLGLNGAGKTTTIKLLLGHARPTKGVALLFGIDAMRPESRSRVGYLPDLPNFYRFLSARELLDYSGKLFGLKASVRRERREALLKRVGLDGRGDEALGGFSRGMLQRAGLAQALIGDPSLVILDEPLGGLDPIGRVELREIIASLKKEGRTVFFSSHILDDAQRIADRVGIIHKGALRACGTLDELLTRNPGWEAEFTAKATPVEDICRTRGWGMERGGSAVIISDDAGLKELYRLAAAGEINLKTVGPRRLTLEEAFLAEVGRWS